MAESRYNRRGVMTKAWAIAKHDFDHYGECSLRGYFKAALKLAWNYEKALVAEMKASNARVQAEIDRMRFASSQLGRAQHEKRLAECAARAEAGVDRANEIVRQLGRSVTTRAA
jgi:hypothetical protein